MLWGTRKVLKSFTGFFGICCHGCLGTVKRIGGKRQEKVVEVSEGKGRKKVVEYSGSGQAPARSPGIRGKKLPPFPGNYRPFLVIPSNS